VKTSREEVAAFPLLDAHSHYVGALEESWRALLEGYPDRVLVGVDFFSTVHLARARDAGEYLRGILSQLTPATARKLAFENAERLYGLR